MSHKTTHDRIEKLQAVAARLQDTATHPTLNERAVAPAEKRDLFDEVCDLDAIAERLRALGHNHAADAIESVAHDLAAHIDLRSLVSD